MESAKRPAEVESSPAATRTDEIASLARSGDPNSLQALFERVSPALYAWARLHLRGPLAQRLDPEDVVQEVAVRVLSGFERWNPEAGAFRAYAFGIAKNVLRQALERMAREPSRGVSLPPRSPSVVTDTATTLTRAVCRDESLRLLVDEIEQLPDDDRRLLLHRGLEGLPHETVAEALSITLEAVEKRWQRLCDRLRHHPRFQSLVA